MKVHELKIVDPYFDQIRSGKKTFEARQNDRNFKNGDILHLRLINEKGEYVFCTYNELIVKVTSILYGPKFGIQEGYCVMSIKLLS